MSIAQMNQSKTADFRRIVERANGTIHKTKMILGFLTWFAITATIWLGLFAADNLLDLPTALRFPFAIAGLIITIGTFLKYVVGSFRTHQSDERVALMLEEQFDIEENVLINTMQFEDMGYSDKQKEFILATANAAKNGWSHVPLRQLWQPGRMAKWGTVFAMLLVLWIGYGIVAPNYLGNAFARYAFSFNDTPPAASALLTLTPNSDVTIAEYEDLEVTLDVSRFTDGEPLMVYPAVVSREGMGLVPNDRSKGDEVKMRPVVGSPNLYTYTFETVRRSFSFRVFVGGTYTRSVQVTVNAATRIVESVCKITPPAYVALEPREQSGPPYPVKCLPASELDVLIRLDKPVESLQWRWPGGVIPFQDAGKQTWKGSIKVGDTSGNYDLLAVVKGMDKPIVLSSGSVLLKTDKKPEVRFVDMEMNHAVVPGETLPLRFSGKDDYGMKDLHLTLRRAEVGSEPKAIQEWKFGAAPGKQGRIEKEIDLKIDATLFAPGSKYFLEVRGNDFCPTTDSGVSDAMLITVKNLSTNLATGNNSDLKDLYAALERAIVIQKRALEETSGLMVNLDNVWLDMNRTKREDKDIQAALDAYRKRILAQQISVGKTLLEGVMSAPDASLPLAVRMRDIAESACIEANHRAFAAGRKRLGAGKLKRVNGFGPDSFFKKEKIQNVRFRSRPARYIGIVIESTHGWSPKAVIEKLAVVGDEKSAFLEKKDWKLVSSTVPNMKTVFTAPVGMDSLPASFVIDMKTEQAVTGVACKGRKDEYLKGVAVYLTTDQPPKIAPIALDQKRVEGEFKHLKTVQERIYNQLLALKGSEFESLEKKKDAELAALLGEKGEEQGASVTKKIKKIKGKLEKWDEEYKANEALRKVLTSKASEDLSEDEAKELSDLSGKKDDLIADLKGVADDLAGEEWDPSKAEVELYEITLHNIQEKIDKAKVLDLMAKEPPKKKKEEMSKNMDSTGPQSSPKEVDTAQQAPNAGEGIEPGQSEDDEDSGGLEELGALPAKLPLNISELGKGLDEMPPPFPESGSELADHNSPAGSPVSDNLDSATAAGQMTDRTPNPMKKIKGRGNVGRAGQADGEMAADKAPAIPDNQAAMPPRLSNSVGQGAGAPDEGSIPPTGIGLGKHTGTPSEFGEVGKLPPDELDKLKELLGDADSKSRENTRGLLLALNAHNLPTTDLKKAIERLEQIKNGKQGIDVRQTLAEIKRHYALAEKAIAKAYEIRAQQLANGSYEAHDSNVIGVAVPAGFENMVSDYFKAVAEESNKK